MKNESKKSTDFVGENDAFFKHFLILQDTVSVHRPGFYAHRFLDFMADKVFKKIPSRKDHFRFSPRSAYSSFSITTSDARFYNVMVLNPATGTHNTKLTLTNAKELKQPIMASAGTFNVLAVSLYLVSSPNNQSCLSLITVFISIIMWWAMPSRNPENSQCLELKQSMKSCWSGSSLVFKLWT